jgi:DNA invertase Pin-like site-specific DNA recombinase
MNYWLGYARVSTEQQDLTAQRNGLQALGVSDDYSTMA